LVAGAGEPVEAAYPGPDGRSVLTFDAPHPRLPAFTMPRSVDPDLLAICRMRRPGEPHRP
jgi:hypothetical protein